MTTKPPNSPQILSEGYVRKGGLNTPKNPTPPPAPPGSLHRKTERPGGSGSR